MKLNVFLLVILQICLPILTIQAIDLQALETERELRGLVKIQLHGEPLRLVNEVDNNVEAEKTIAFSPDGKHLAVGYTPGSVLIYDIAAEKAKRFDRELDKMKQEVKKIESK